MTPFKSEKYKKWVRSHPCCVCGGVSTDAHHVIGLHWSLSGMGMKAPDSFCMPVCRTCHSAIHQSHYLQSLQPEWLMDIINKGLDSFWGEGHEALEEALNFVEQKVAA